MITYSTAIQCLTIDEIQPASITSLHLATVTIIKHPQYCI